MEFYDDRVIVNPLRIKREYINELENNLLLYYTSKSRVSAEIIEQQQQNVLSDNRSSVEAMHVIKQQAANCSTKGSSTRSDSPRPFRTR